MGMSEAYTATFKLGDIVILGSANHARAWIGLASLIGHYEISAPSPIDLAIHLTAVTHAEELASRKEKLGHDAQEFYVEDRLNIAGYQQGDLLVFIGPGAHVTLDTSRAELSAVIAGDDDAVSYAMEWVFEIAFMYAMRTFDLFYLHGCYLSSPSGVPFYLLGPSGRGKTTLALHLMQAGYGCSSDNWNLVGQTRDGDIVNYGIRTSFNATPNTEALFTDWLGPRAYVGAVPSRGKRAYDFRMFEGATEPAGHVGCDSLFYISAGPSETDRFSIDAYSEDQMLLRLTEESTSIGQVMIDPGKLVPMAHGAIWRRIENPLYQISDESFQVQLGILRSLCARARCHQMLNGLDLASQGAPAIQAGLEQALLPALAS